MARWQCEGMAWGSNHAPIFSINEALSNDKCDLCAEERSEFESENVARSNVSLAAIVIEHRGEIGQKLTQNDGNEIRMKLLTFSAQDSYHKCVLEQRQK